MSTRRNHDFGSPPPKEAVPLRDEEKRKLDPTTLRPEDEPGILWQAFRKLNDRIDSHNRD